MPNQPKTPQMTTRIDRVKRAKLGAIAKIRKERDALGFGASVVVRRAVDDYLRKHEHLLPPDWQPPADDD